MAGEARKCGAHYTIAREINPTVFVDEQELVNWMVGTLSANWHVSYETSQEFFSKVVNEMVAREPAIKLPSGALAFKYARLNVVAHA